MVYTSSVENPINAFSARNERKESLVRTTFRPQHYFSHGRATFPVVKQQVALPFPWSSNLSAEESAENLSKLVGSASKKKNNKPIRLRLPYFKKIFIINKETSNNRQDFKVRIKDDIVRGSSEAGEVADADNYSFK